MEKIIRNLEQLYNNSNKIRFLSDTDGNILWSNCQNKKEKTVIYFTDTIDCRYSELHETVTINGEKFAASGSMTKSDDGKHYIIWQADNITDILLNLGRTDTFTDTTFMISNARSNLRQLLNITGKVGEKLSGNNELTQDIHQQLKQCYELMRNVETINQISSVIYQKHTADSALYITEEIESAVSECNRVLSNSNIRFNINSKNTEENCLCINASHHSFQSVMLTIFKKILGCSSIGSININIVTTDKAITVTMPYKFDEECQKNAFTDDFEMYSSRMYIRCIGGVLTEESEGAIHIIKLVLPVYNPLTFHSSVSKYNAKTTDDLAEIYLYGLREEFK